MSQSALDGHFATLLANMQEGVLVEDENRKIILVNQLFLDMFQIPASPEQMVGYDCSNAAEDSKDFFLNPEEFVFRIESILKKREKVQNDLLELVSGGFLERDFTPVFEGEAYLGHMWTYRNVSEREESRRKIDRLNQILAEQVKTDSLTGVLNRRGLQARAIAEVRRNQRYGRVLSLAMIDLDHFKKINDEHGHLHGDEILRELGKILSETIRESDVVGRFGGEEFVLVMPDTDLVGAENLCERIRQRFSSAHFLNIGATLSAGVTEYRESSTRGDYSATDQLQKLIKQADTALYKAKETGRNRICSYDE